jgi:hypothetical protein
MMGKYLDRDEKLATSAPAFPAKAGTHGSGAPNFSSNCTSLPTTHKLVRRNDRPRLAPGKTSWIGYRRIPGAPTCQEGDYTPSSDSQTFDTTPGRVTVSRGAKHGQGQPLSWWRWGGPRKAPGPEEPAAWRNYPTPPGPALPGSVGQRCFRPSATEDVPPFHGGASKPAHAGAPAAPPMLSPQVQGVQGQRLQGRPQRPRPQATPDTATAAYRGCRETPAADCTAGRRGLGLPGD